MKSYRSIELQAKIITSFFHNVDCSSYLGFFKNKDKLKTKKRRKRKRYRKLQENYETKSKHEKNDNKIERKRRLEVQNWFLFL